MRFPEAGRRRPRRSFQVMECDGRTLTLHKRRCRGQRRCHPTGSPSADWRHVRGGPRGSPSLIRGSGGYGLRPQARGSDLSLPRAPNHVCGGDPSAPRSVPAEPPRATVSGRQRALRGTPYPDPLEGRFGTSLGTPPPRPPNRVPGGSLLLVLQSWQPLADRRACAETGSGALLDPVTPFTSSPDTRW